MKNFKRIFIIVILGLLFFFFGKEKLNNPDQNIRKKEAVLRLIQSSRELHRIWTEGEDSREWHLVRDQCLKKYSITESFDESLLRCHPMLIDCIDQFLPKKSFTLDLSSFLYPSYVFTLRDEVTSEKLDVALSDDCHEIYLEQNVYAYGEAPKERDAVDYQFDTFNRHIYFDQHLITNSEINEWLKYDKSNATQGLRPVDAGNALFLPATHLTLKQMQNYCSFKGKQLMTASIFDAATFLSQDRLRPPYHWTKKRKETNISCEYIFSKDCSEERKWKINSSPPSWAGLYDALGGVMEVVANPVDPESNLKASSIYFSKNSSWHRLGVRANWDGEGNEFRNFNFKGILPEMTETKYQVGFRCMRSVGAP